MQQEIIVSHLFFCLPLKKRMFLHHTQTARQYMPHLTHVSPLMSMIVPLDYIYIF